MLYVIRYIEIQLYLEIVVNYDYYYWNSFIQFLQVVYLKALQVRHLTQITLL